MSDSELAGGGQACVQGELVPAGPRKKIPHPNAYGKLRKGLRTEFETFLNLIPQQSPVFDEIEERTDTIIADSGGEREMTFVKRQVIRKFVILDMLVDSYLNDVMEGKHQNEIPARDARLMAALGKLSELGKTIGLDKFVQERSLNISGKVEQKRL